MKWCPFSLSRLFVCLFIIPLPSVDVCPPVRVPSFPSACLPTCLSTLLSVCLCLSSPATCLPGILSVYIPGLCLSVCLSVCLAWRPVCLVSCLFIYPASVCLSVCLSSLATCLSGILSVYLPGLCQSVCLAWRSVHVVSFCVNVLVGTMTRFC